MIRLLATWPGRVAALLLVAALGAGGVYVAGGNGTPAKPDLRTTAVTRGNVTQTVSVSGSVNASGQVRLAFKTGGRLARILVTTGQTVTAGQPLAKLDTTDLEAALATAQQNLANAQAAYQKQVLAANDQRAALAEAQRSTAVDVANAEAALARLRSSYAAAKTNFTSLSDGTTKDLRAYAAAIDTLRAQVQQVLTDVQPYLGGDVGSAKASLNSADLALASAQSYAAGLLGTSLSEYGSARDTLLAAASAFDVAFDAGGDTSAAVTGYQTAQLGYNVALAKLQSAMDAVTGQVASAQTSVSAAAGSLNTTSSRGNPSLDAARTSVAVAQASLTTQSVAASAARTKLQQAGTPLGTITEAVANGLVNASTAVASARDRAATTLRNAQSAVANIPYNLQTAQASVENAQNAVAAAQANVDNATLVAPTAGIVATIANQVGEYVSGGNTNAAFIVLTNTSAMVLHGTVGEGDVAKLRLGLVANVTVDALSGQRMTGKVTSLDPVATISQGVPVYGIDVAIDVPAPGLRAGMSGTASLILASKTNVLIVPNSVIRTVNGQRGVQVLKGGEVVDTPVQFGLANESVTEVVSGLAEGDVVVIPSTRASTSANPGGQQQRPGGGQIIRP